jgi:hypothetical protein
MSLHHYEGKRYMLFDHGIVGPPWRVQKGICPGSPAATGELKLMMLAGLLHMRTHFPAVSITVHVDDYRIEVAGRHNDDVIAAAEEIDHQMQAEWQRLGMQQAPEKQEIYATNPELERQLGRMLHIEQHKQGVAAMLGVDLAYSSRLHKSPRRRCKLAQRLAKRKARRRLVKTKVRESTPRECSGGRCTVLM